MNNFTAAVRKILQTSGFERLRSGKGDHEVWINRANGKRAIVDSKIKSRHTANNILKEAGLPKAF